MLEVWVGRGELHEFREISISQPLKVCVHLLVIYLKNASRFPPPRERTNPVRGSSECEV